MNANKMYSGENDRSRLEERMDRMSDDGDDTFELSDAPITGCDNQQIPDGYSSDDEPLQN